MAIHPSAGKFLIDNAANSGQPNGINSIDTLMAKAEDAGLKFRVVNGYLLIPEESSDEGCGKSSRGVQGLIAHHSDPRNERCAGHSFGPGKDESFPN